MAPATCGSNVTATPDSAAGAEKSLKIELIRPRAHLPLGLDLNAVEHHMGYDRSADLARAMPAERASCLSNIKRVLQRTPYTWLRSRPSRR
jgi:hypothetical protein